MMRRADRLLQIIQIMRRHRRPVRGAALAAELEISLRSLYRDISDLMAQGVPIRGEAGVGYVLEKGYDLPPLMFTSDELEAIILGLRFVSRRGDPELVKAAIDTVAKIATVLPSPLKPALLEAALLVPPHCAGLADRIDVASVRQAIRKSLKAHIHYHDEKQSFSERTIWPIAIAYFDKQKLVVAWCESRQDFRSFRTDRMAQFILQAEKYPERRSVLLKRWRQQLSAADQSGFDIVM